MNNKFDQYDIAFSSLLARIKPNIAIKMFSKLGSIFFVSAVVVFFVLLNDKLYNRIGIVCLVSLMLNTIVVFILKMSFRRKRPTDENTFQEKFDPYSFPSGHVARLAGLILPTITLITYPIFFLFLALICGISRIILKYHVLSDCIVGLGVGLGAGAVAFLAESLYIDLAAKILKLIGIWG